MEVAQWRIAASGCCSWCPVVASICRGDGDRQWRVCGVLGLMLLAMFMDAYGGVY